MNSMSNELEWELYLFVKAPLIKGDKDSKFGEDIFTHRFMFMIAKKQIPNSNVVPVDPVYKKDILAKFKIEDYSLKLPFIMHVFKDKNTRLIVDRILADDLPQIEVYLEEKFQPRLECKDPLAYKVQLDVFQKFMFFMKAAKGSSTENAKLNLLNEELKKIDRFLADTGGQFLGGDTITLPDCNLLPKLHYIRVAGKYFKQFQIPDELAALKKYVEAGDLDEAFQDSKCTDKEIIEGFACRR